MSDKPKFWTGRPPQTCDTCNAKITDSFSDVLVPAFRMWGFVCDDCFTKQGCTTGIGRGQRYKLAESGLFEKLEG